ncbi:hypothetical protein [Streptomyces uncialis]|uniref:hypothetical protein n=1 Tax=Streptomyces uncialis TaxID=1048205 RepID=UPI002F909397|nr:hypothetical protein OG268_37065 [Streptomyces uncialis]
MFRKHPDSHLDEPQSLPDRERPVVDLRPGAARPQQPEPAPGVDEPSTTRRRPVIRLR